MAGELRVIADTVQDPPVGACRLNADQIAKLCKAADAMGVSVDEYRAVAQLGNPEKSLVELKAGAERLGVGWRDAIHWAAAVANWTRHGFPSANKWKSSGLNARYAGHARTIWRDAASNAAAT